MYQSLIVLDDFYADAVKIREMALGLEYPDHGGTAYYSGRNSKQALINQGIVEQLLHALQITSKPSAIPTQLEADISALGIGGSVRVRDLTLPEGVTTDVDGDEQIAIGSVTRAAQEEEPEVEAAEGEGGEAAAEGGAAEGAGGGEAAPSGDAE